MMIDDLRQPEIPTDHTMSNCSKVVRQRVVLEGLKKGIRG